MATNPFVVVFGIVFSLELWPSPDGSGKPRSFKNLFY